MTTCQHSATFTLRPPTAATAVYREECTQCFASQDDPAGLVVCLQCYNAGCPEHARRHSVLSGHTLGLRVKRRRKTMASNASAEDGLLAQTAATEPPRKVTKLVVEAPKAEHEEFDLATSVVCLPCSSSGHANALATGSVFVVDNAELAERARNAVLFATSAKQQGDIQAWEEQPAQPCEHTLCLEQVQGTLVGKSMVVTECTDCELKENLWLCMTCGNLGCGRRQYDGTGGNNHGIDHFSSTGHPVACKLGTITAEGTADIYCYACDDMKTDPELGAHLSTFGVNIAQQQKTVKSMAELQLDQNMKFDFSMATADGQAMRPVFGPWLTGMRNIGNSCYLASLVQAVFSLPAFKSYVGDAHSAACQSSSPASCYLCQMSKLANGLSSGVYSVPAKVDGTPNDGPGFQSGIAPTLFKALIGKGHAEFGGMRQQDAFEFYQHLLKTIDQKEHPLALAPPRATDTFRFTIAQRLQCTSCERVRYADVVYDSLAVPVPARPLPAGDDGEKRWEPVTLSECLKLAVGEESIEGFRCPQCQCAVTATKTLRFKTFPGALVLNLQRFVLENWVPVKLNIPVVLGAVDMDLSAFKSPWPLANDVLLPEESDAATTSSTANSSEPQVNASAIDALMSMGFTRNRSIRALLATGDAGAEVAMEWLFSKMDDASLDDPVVVEAAPAVSSTTTAAAPAHLIESLGEMGFTAKQATKALRKCSNDMERAVEWLFSHPDDDGTDEDAASSSAAATPTVNVGLDSSAFRAHAIVSHKGTSVHCGHYVAYVNTTSGSSDIGRTDGQWVLFNDEKVVEQPDALAADGMRQAYIVVLRNRG